MLPVGGLAARQSRKARPTGAFLQLLRALTTDKKNTIVVRSGRSTAQVPFHTTNLKLPAGHGEKPISF